MCLEWWSYEILGVVGSAFGETATAVQTVLVNFSYFMYAAGEGIAISAGLLSLSHTHTHTHSRHIQTCTHARACTHAQTHTNTNTTGRRCAVRTLNPKP